MIIIPDIHGRPFWRSAVRGRENEEIVFLGDYLDPYPKEFITTPEAIDNFKDILLFKERHPDNVSLLLGNHDFGYLWSGEINNSRRNERYRPVIVGLFRSHFDRFALAHYRKVNGRGFLFSHAGVHAQWLDVAFSPWRESYRPEGLADMLNRWLHSPGEKERFLGMYSGYRSFGYRPLPNFGSCVWADLQEWTDEEENIQHNKLLNLFQIFGHTQQEVEPYVGENFMCIDVRRAFELTEDGIMHDDFHPCVEITYNLNERS